MRIHKEVMKYSKNQKHWIDHLIKLSEIKDIDELDMYKY